MTDIEQRIADIVTEVLRGNVPLADAIAEKLVSELGLHEMPEAPGYYMTDWVRKELLGPSHDATRSGGRLFRMGNPE